MSVPTWGSFPTLCLTDTNNLNKDTIVPFRGRKPFCMAADPFVTLPLSATSGGSVCEAALLGARTGPCATSAGGHADGQVDIYHFDVLDTIDSGKTTLTATISRYCAF